MKKLVAVIAILSAVFVGGAVTVMLIIASQDGFNKAATIPQAPTCTVDGAQLLAAINAERSMIGSPALATDPVLSSTAATKLQDMASGHYYGHYLLDGSSPYSIIRNQGVKATISEDIDLNALSPSEDWSAFKNSPGHYKSLTDPQYTRIGISTQCVNYPIEHVTGPDDNSALVGRLAKELTVVHLAAPEPVAQAPQP